MKNHLPLIALAAGSVMLLQACGGGSSADEPASAGANGTALTAAATAAGGMAVAQGTAPTLAQRTAAATAAATGDAACTSLNPFYWEIGDKSGRLASGNGGTGTTFPPNQNTVLPTASASKWLFSTYVVEKKLGVLSAQDVKQLNFTSGYANLSDCSATASVSSCLGEPGQLGNGTNGDYIASRDGHFFYNGGHMQVLANSMGLGLNTVSPLATSVKAVDGTELSTLGYAEPQLAGGARMSAAHYGQFLRNMINGRYRYMPALLGQHAVCTHTNSGDCPGAQYSPVNQSLPGGPNDISDEAWHYALGHWVEDDPMVGDGAFSSPGRFGYYPWIDRSKSWYGVLARFDAGNLYNPDPKKAPYHTSVECGRRIRAAWLNPANTVR